MKTTKQTVEPMRNYLNAHQYFIRGDSTVYDDRYGNVSALDNPVTIEALFQVFGV